MGLVPPSVVGTRWSTRPSLFLLLSSHPQYAHDDWKCSQSWLTVLRVGSGSTTLRRLLLIVFFAYPEDILGMSHLYAQQCGSAVAAGLIRHALLSRHVWQNALRTFSGTAAAIGDDVNPFVHYKDTGWCKTFTSCWIRGPKVASVHSRS